MSPMKVARSLDGKALAARMLASLAPRVAALLETRGNAPLLAILSIGGGAPTQLFLKSKLEACKQLGIETTVQSLHDGATLAEAERVLEDLSKDENTDGIVLDLPLPPQLEPRRLLERLNPDKDVEGMTLTNFGRLFAAKSAAEVEASQALVPCTPAAILALLEDARVPVAGKEAVVLGRSNIVGKPTAHLLSCLDATVTLCHSRTRGLASHLKRADIVVTAIGRPQTVTGEMLKPGVVILDAGISSRDGKVVGDVDRQSAAKIASFFTPVPGGVGPVTIAALLRNTVTAAERHTRRRLT